MMVLKKRRKERARWAPLQRLEVLGEIAAAAGAGLAVPLRHAGEGRALFLGGADRTATAVEHGLAVPLGERHPVGEHERELRIERRARDVAFGVAERGGELDALLRYDLLIGVDHVHFAIGPGRDRELDEASRP